MPPKNNKAPVGHFEQAVDKLKDTNNILVTVSANPSLDQLASCIGLTIALNKLGKHATAVFSGKIPPSIEFLKPEKTIETNTNSLRDFIIALDKSKADKLRYKVEDDVVKIYITPYKTSIDEKDLDFSQGDFNVETIVAIGVEDRGDLDAAITAHGRILHDATVIGISNKAKSNLAAIDWVETRASSLSEMVSDIVIELKRDVLDTQIATAFLTGVVAETDRFRNEKVSPHTMSISGVLMSAGASTQLVATKLEESRKKAEREAEEAEKAKDQGNDKASVDGTLSIKHGSSADAEEPEEDNEEVEIPEVQPEEEPKETDNIHIDEQGDFHSLVENRYLNEDQEPKPEEEKPEEDPESRPAGEPAENTPGLVMDPPSLGGQLTANSVPEDQQYGSSTDPLSSGIKKKGPILGRSEGPKDETPTEESAADQFEAHPSEPKKPTVDEVESILTDKGKTLNQIEEEVDSPHLNVDDALANAHAAADAAPPQIPEPRQSIGAQTLGDQLNAEDAAKKEDSDTPSSPPPPVPPPLMPPSNP